MKKIYQKPQIMFEDFSVSTNIATGCEHISNGTYAVCPIELPGFGGLQNVVVFTSEVSGCTAVNPNGYPDGYNGVCYHVPSEANNVFTS